MQQPINSKITGHYTGVETALSWPSTTATFPGSCKECNAEWKKGVKIYGINADTDKQKRWCSNANCPDSAGVPPPTKPVAQGTGDKYEMKFPAELMEEFTKYYKILTPDLVEKHHAAWTVSLFDAGQVHSHDLTESIRSKYILACVFYKGLMGVS